MTSICKLEQLLKIYTDLEALSICHFLLNRWCEKLGKLGHQTPPKTTQIKEIAVEK